MTFQTRRRVGYVYCMASRRSTTTSPKPLTEKPYQVPTSRTDKKTGLEKHTGPHDQTCSIVITAFDEILGKKEDQVSTNKQFLN